MSLDRATILEKLSLLPGRVKRLVDQNPPDILCEAGVGGGWGAVEIVAFLRDWDEVTSDRIDFIVSSDEPELEDPDPDIWSIERDYHAEDPRKVVDEVRKRREALVAKLERLDDSAWQRTARMPDGTVVTLQELMSRLVTSDQEHYRSLRNLLR